MESFCLHHSKHPSKLTEWRPPTSVHALFPVSPTPHVCFGLYYASHREFRLFTQLTRCRLMFSGSTIGPLSPVFCVHSTMRLWPTCLQCTVKVSKYDRSCQSQKLVKKNQKKTTKHHSAIRWRNGGIICLLHRWYPTSESLCDKLSEVLNQKTHLCFLWSVLWSLSKSIWEMPHVIFFLQIPRWTAAFNLWTCSTVFNSRTFVLTAYVIVVCCKVANGLERTQSGFGCVLDEYESLGLCLMWKKKIETLLPWTFL